MFDEKNFSFKTALESDTDMELYGPNALAIFALGLYLLHDDHAELAAQALTDGSDDKKIDLCWLDESEGRLIVGQAYHAQEWGKAAAPANKASDLNTAVSWLLSADLNEVPARLRPLAMEVRDAITSGSIRHVDVIYIHNCFESTNVKSELRAVATNTQIICRSISQNEIAVTHRELGLESIQEIYESIDKDIKVESSQEFEYTGECVVEECERWRSVVLTIKGSDLKRLYEEHGEDLFSANVRDYLGLSARRGNINAGIKSSAASEPDNFWAYNNGITALTHEFEVSDDVVSVRGISIINGAQTTGALSESDDEDLDKVRVVCRIVECRDKDIVSKIIAFNNTQNVVRPSDLRSNHPTQKRLSQAFDQHGITYVVRRSSGRAPRSSISAEALAPALCAFHGDPQTATRQRRDIFESDSTFERVFPASISAGHIQLVYCMGLAFDRLKGDLKVKVSEETATTLEGKQYDLLRYSGSKFFMLYLVGSSAEELLGRRVPAIVQWRATTASVVPGGGDLVGCCVGVLQAVVPLVAASMAEGEKAYDLTRSIVAMRRLAVALKGQLSALQVPLASQLECLRRSSAVGD